MMTTQYKYVCMDQYGCERAPIRDTIEQARADLETLPAGCYIQYLGGDLKPMTPKQPKGKSTEEQKLVIQAAKDMMVSRYHLNASRKSYKLARQALREANMHKIPAWAMARVFKLMNEARHQLRQDMKACKAAVEWYQNIAGASSTGKAH